SGIMADLLDLVSVAFVCGKEGGSHCLLRTYFLYYGLVLSVVALSCGSSLAQQEPASMPKAQQVPLSGRSPSGGHVHEQESSSSNGGGSSANTVNSTIQVSGAYQGSVPDPNPPQSPLTLNLADAVQRGLRFNLGS